MLVSKKTYEAQLVTVHRDFSTERKCLY